MGTGYVRVSDALAAYVNRLRREEAHVALLRCCGAERWVDALLAARPFENDAVLFETAERAWWELDPADWQEAFTAHPRIGEQPGPLHAATRAWSEQEQAGRAGANAATRVALAEGNRTYEERFGHVFLICATGLSAETMLGELERRLENERDDELRVAAAEQAKITRLRLEKLVRS